MNYKSFNLVRWFAVLALISIGLASVISALLLSRFLTHHMLQRDAVLSMEYVQSVAQTQKAWAHFTIKENGRGREDFENFFAHIAALPDVLRANVYGADRTVIWSSDPVLIGRNPGPNPELEKALRA